MDISEGAVVRLKSGGPDMTVREITPRGVAFCEWFSESGEINMRDFSIKSLVLVQDVEE
jgi:uncharacterized protein YodC (DUF2158 family)